MTGRPVRLLTAVAFAAAASLLSASSASACYSGCGIGYAAPVYLAPVVYSYSYVAPIAYGSCASRCGYGGYAGYGGYGTYVGAGYGYGGYGYGGYGYRGLGYRGLGYGGWGYRGGYGFRGGYAGVGRVGRWR